MFKLRIRASDEVTACIFSGSIISAIEKISGQPLKPAIINLIAHEYYKPRIEAYDRTHQYLFVDMYSQDFADDIAKVDTLIALGINCIIISRINLDWKEQDELFEGTEFSVEDTPKEEHKIFENYLAEHNIITIVMESYGFDREEEKYFVSHGPSRRQSLSEIVRVMINEYQDGSIVEPWGAVPYFILAPEVSDESLKTATFTRVIAGFQCHMDKQSLDRFGPVSDYPDYHWLPIPYNWLKIGPIKINRSHHK